MRYLVAFALLALPLLGTAGSLAEIEIYDRTAGRVLPIHEHRGRLYVAGEPQHQYEVRVRNKRGGRVLAVTSVDGVNVISGATAAETQDGYVIGAHDSVAIEGWRKSLDDVATFYFTRLPDSYAARTGRPDNVGVIGVALFQRKPEPVLELEQSQNRGEPGAAADGAARSAAPRAAEKSIGTGHGRSEASQARYVAFERESDTPNEVVVIHYDTYANLVARGVIPQPPRWPSPFPGGFVPDPPGRG